MLMDFRNEMVTMVAVCAVVQPMDVRRDHSQVVGVVMRVNDLAVKQSAMEVNSV
jgi:hypothetical protein